MANTHQQRVHHEQRAHHGRATGWTGWIIFASLVIALSGIYHIALGIGALFDQGWYIYDSGSIWWFNSDTWGLTMILGGILLAVTAGLLMLGNMVGRVLATVLAVASLFANIALAPVAPIWSAIAAVLDILIIYAIIAHGGEMKHLNE